MKYFAMSLAVLAGIVWLGHNRRPGRHVRAQIGQLTDRMVNRLPLRYDSPFALAAPRLDLFQLVEEDYPPEQWPSQAA